MEIETIHQMLSSIEEGNTPPPSWRNEFIKKLWPLILEEVRSRFKMDAIASFHDPGKRLTSIVFANSRPTDFERSIVVRMLFTDLGPDPEDEWKPTIEMLETGITQDLIQRVFELHSESRIHQLIHEAKKPTPLERFVLTETAQRIDPGIPLEDF